MAKQKSNNYVYQRERDIQSIPYLRREGQKINKQLGGGESIEGSIIVNPNPTTYSPFYTENFNEGSIPAGWVNDVTLPWAVETAGLGGKSGSYFKSPQLLAASLSTSVSLTYDFGLGYSAFTLKMNIYQDTELCCDILRVKINEITYAIATEFNSPGWEERELTIYGVTGLQDVEFIFSTDSNTQTGLSEVAFTDLIFTKVDISVLNDKVILPDPYFPNTLTIDTFEVLTDITIFNKDSIPLKLGAGKTGSGTRFGLDSLLVATGEYNVAMGDRTLRDTTTGKENVAIGGRTMYKNISGSYNTALGTFAMDAGTSNNKMTVVGNNAMFMSENSEACAVLGHYAGRVGNLDNGNWSKADTFCTFLGAYSGRESTANGGLPITTPMDNSTTVGANSKAIKSNQIVLGNTAVTEVLTYGAVKIKGPDYASIVLSDNLDATANRGAILTETPDGLNRVTNFSSNTHASWNWMNIGGGLGTNYAMTNIDFFVAPNTTTLNGNLALAISDAKIEVKKPLETITDVEVTALAGAAGIILTDATLGTRHRITLDNGALVVGAAL